MNRIQKTDIPGYLGKRIAEGEHQQQDFKFAINDARKIAETLSAFANTDGGRLLVGVKDNGKVAGVRNDEEMHMIEGAADLYCNPPIEMDFQVWEIDNKRVLEVWINASPNRPHKAKTEDDKWRAFIRVNDENFMASPIHLHRWSHEDKEDTAPGTFTEDEKTLLKIIREEPLTLNQLCKKSDFFRQDVIQSVGAFFRWNLVQLYRDKGKWIIDIA
ncbi:MAG: ATP-binding protein [Cryomorphaceae bacterium]|nr:ATP-binding protein [Cryomorphaceae bacterium]